MTVPSNDRLRELEHELKATQTELIEVRRQQKQHTIRRQWLLRTGMLGVALILIGSWTWSAQASNPIPPDIEKRLSALESLVRKGPGNTVQVTAPFDVMGPDGKAILRVGSGAPTAGAVAIWSTPDKPGRVAIRSDEGTALAELGFTKEGYGAVSAADDEGVIRAQVYGSGKVVVLNEDKKILAAMGAGKELAEVLVVGRVAVLSDNGSIRAILNNSGQVIVTNEDQTPVAKMEATDKGSGRVVTLGEVIVVDEKENKLVGLESTKEGRGQVTVWHKKNKVAVMEVGAQEAGVVSVLNSENKAVVKMSVDQGQAGKLNIMNSAGNPVASMMGGEATGGLIVVANSSSVPLAQMSVSGDGRGLVQVIKKTGQNPVAVLTEAVERPGGLLQISNSNGPVANVTVGEGGGGYFQLSNTAGTPNIEAGSLPDGRGTIRTGPLYKCAPTGTPLFRGGGLPDCLMGASGK